MIVAKVKIYEASAMTVWANPITAGMIGAEVEIEYAGPVWAVLTKTVVFSGAVVKDVIANDTVIGIPAECLAVPNAMLKVGVYGIAADDTIAIPTLWAPIGRVLRGTDPSGDETTNPTLPVWAEILEAAKTAEQIAQDLRQDAEAGRFDGKDGDPGSPGYTPVKGVDYFTPDEVAGIEVGAAAKLEPNISQLKDDIAAVSAVCGTLENTEDGMVIQLTDCAERPLKGLRVFGRTVQDGTPTPEAPVELESVGDGGSVSVMVCGKNLFADGKVYTGGLDSSYGQLNTSNPATSPAHRLSWAGVGIRVAVSPNETYTVSSDVAPCKYFTVTFYRKFDSVGSKANAISFKEFTNRNNATFTTPENCHCVVITSVSNIEADYTWSWWQLEHGSVATTYEPYEGQTLSISTPNGLPGIPVYSGGNYTDANGQQWICDEVDFARGVHVQRIGTIDSYAGEAVSEPYLSTTGALSTGAKVLYVLATPIETPIPEDELAAYAALHTYKPNTTIYNDADAQMEVNYQADTKLYIDKQFVELRNAIVSLGGNI